jgi:hypothetical protein
MAKYKITIDSSKIDSNLTNFPLTVKLDGVFGGWSSLTQDNGYFRNENNTILDHEVEYYVQGSQAVYHVRVPTVSSSSNTYIYLYTNGSGYTNGNNPTGVWDSNFLGVYHMETGLDSTSNNNDGVVTGTTTIAGLNGLSKSFDGTDDWIQLPFTTKNETAMTYSIIGRTDTTSTDNDQMPIWEGQSGANGYGAEEERHLYIPYFNRSDNIGFHNRNVNGNHIIEVPYTNLSYDHWSVTLDNAFTTSDLVLYLGGSVASSLTQGGASLTSNFDTNIRIGQNGANSRYFDGVIDEVRISNVARSSAWIKAEYHSLFGNLILNIETEPTINLGNLNVSKLYLGNNKITKAYLGNNDFYNDTPAIIPFELGTVTYDNTSIIFGSTEPNPSGFKFNNFGTIMYIVGLNSDTVIQYSLSIPYNVGSAVLTSNKSFSFIPQGGNPQDIAFNNTGTKMIMVTAVGDSCYQYTLSTPFDVSTATYDNVSLQLDNNYTNFPVGVSFDPSGSRMYIVCTNYDNVAQYNLSTPFDISTATYASNFVFTPQEEVPRDIVFNNDGSKLFMVGTISDSINQYSLSTPYEINTMSFDNISIDLTAQEATVRMIACSPDGTKFFIGGNDNDTIYQYTNTF